MSNAALPLVSICIPTYNAGKTIRETLASIITQSYTNLDIRVVDNASTDDTLMVVAEFDDPRIRIHRNEVNVGGEGNFNRCIQLATGKYTAIFHADDLYEPHMVERQVAFMEIHPEAGAVFTEASLIDMTGNRIGSIKLPREFNSPDYLYGFEVILKAVLRHSNFLICPSVLARTNVYQQEIKSWRGEMFKSSADLDVWLRIAQQHPIGLLPQPLMRYRISDSQFSASVRQRTERADFFLVIDYYLALTEIKSRLNPCDIENYVRLDRRDRVMRAINSLQMEQRRLLHDIYSWSSLKAALQTKRGLGVLIIGSYLRLLLLFNLHGVAPISLAYLKRLMHK